jgi:diguanylate cyclase (GGDEF)-like protein
VNDLPDRSNARQLRVVAGAIATVLFIGLIDYVTGAEASVAPLYLVPIALATWFVSLRVGLLLAGLSAVIRLQDLWLTTHHYAHPLTPYWNGVVELGFFVVVALILARLRTTSEHWATLAQTDPLTGVLNRRAFTEIATIELARAERYQRSLTLAYLDIDDFKKVNDEGGHDYGDRLLVEVAQTLRRNLRAFDTVARYGGDEFVLLLPETGDEAADLVLEKLMAAFRATTRGRWPVSLSIGAVTISGPRTTLDQLIQQADRLVYVAKQDGKDRIRHRRLHRGGTVGIELTPAPKATILRPIFPTPSSSVSSTVLHAKGR